MKRRIRHLLACWWESRWRWPSIIAATITVTYLVWPAVDNTSQPPAPPTSAARAWTPPHPQPSSPAHTEPLRQGWVAVAAGFARDFTQTDPRWHRRVARWTSDYLAVELAAVPPYRIPQGSGPSFAIDATGDTLVDLTITYTNGLVLEVRLERVPAAGWQVTRVIPAEADTP